VRGIGRPFPVLIAPLFLAACAGSGTAPKEAVPEGPPLHLAPTTDLAQAASISWLLDVSPRSLASHAELLPAIEIVFPNAHVAAFIERNGFDPLALDEVTAASYSSQSGDSMLYLARGAFAPDRLNATFRRLAGELEGRAVDRQGAQAIVREWGTLRGAHVQLGTFGHEVVALEVGRFGPLRVAELFAQERLKRASPALRSGVLARAAELLRKDSRDAGDAGEAGDAPARAFALGPFEGESAKELGGLVGASTSGAVAAEPEIVGGQAALRVTLVLTGGWGADAAAAADRLAAAFDALSATPLGHLAGLDHPLGSVRVDSFPDAVRLRVALDALALGRGARAATGAEISEIMSY
jgi:hypothetical protein